MRTEVRWFQRGSGQRLSNQDIANKRPSDLQRPILPNGLFHVPFFKLYLDVQHPLMFTIYIYIKYTGKDFVVNVKFYGWKKSNGLSIGANF